MERKLSAILAADVVGYSRLMEQDEAGAFERLRAHRKELFEPEIAKHHGHIFKLMGDGLLAEFVSIVDAVECAVALQRGMAERNVGSVKTQRIDVRLGINLGDVIVEGDDRHGEGVNIAARLQQLAEPGGITVSRTVVNHVKHKLALRFESLGEHHVRNIDEPVAVFRVLMEGSHARPSALIWLANLRRQPLPIAALVLMLMLVSLGLAAWYLYPREASHGGLPSIAVLPFGNLSGDPALDYFSDGVTEDVIMTLSTFPEIRVVARTASFAYRSRSVEPSRVALDLGVRYILEGSVRKTDGEARVTAQLIDAASGENVAAGMFDEEGDDIVALQEGVAEKVFAAIAGFRGEIRKQEERRIFAKAAVELEEYDYYLRGHVAFFRFTKQAMAEAREIWQRGLKRFPDSALLRLKIAISYIVDASYGWSNDPDRDLERAWQLTMEANAADKRSTLEQWYGHWFLAYLYKMHKRDLERAVAEARTTVATVPYDAWSRAELSSILAQAGRTEEAIQWAKAAVRGDPRGPEWYTGNLAWALYLAGQHDAALAELKRMSQPSPFILAAVEAHLGHVERARGLLAKVRTDNPNYRDVSTWQLFEPPAGGAASALHLALGDLKRWPMDQTLLQSYLSDLRTAGWEGR